jgi:hypothetical protein
MPLLNPHQLAASQITERAVDLRSHYAAAAGKLGDITGILLGLPNASLADFGNMLGPAEMEMLLSRHASQGAALNELIAGVNQVLFSVGIAPTSASVDGSPFADKIALQRREIVLSDGVFSVVDFPPLAPAEPLLEEPAA